MTRRNTYVCTDKKSAHTLPADARWVEALLPPGPLLLFVLNSQGDVYACVARLILTSLPRRSLGPMCCLFEAGQTSSSGSRPVWQLRAMIALRNV